MGLEILIAGGTGLVIGLALREDPLIPLIIGAFGATVVPTLPSLLGWMWLSPITMPIAAGMAFIGAGSAIGVVAKVIMQFELPGFIAKIFR